MSTKKIQIIDSLVKQAENADMLDGKHAEEFALASDVATLQTQVGDSSVAEQISAALEEFEPTTSRIETREEIFNQVVQTKSSQTQVVVENTSLDVNNYDVCDITINGTTYRCEAVDFGDGIHLTNVLTIGESHSDFFDIAIFTDSCIFDFSSSGEYNLVIEKPIYHSVVEIDSQLSELSENLVKNNVVTIAINTLQALVGDTSVAEQIENAISAKIADGNEVAY